MFTQISKITLILLIASSVFVSCKKDDVATPQGPTTIEGKWVGKYGYDSEDPSHYYSFDIKADGTIRELDDDQEVLGSGTWQLTGSAFDAVITWDPPFHSTFMVTGYFDAATGELYGAWGYEPSNTDGGEWFLNKKN